MKNLLVFFTLCVFYSYSSLTYAIDRNKIAVSIKPLHSLVKAVTKDTIKVNLITPASISLHEYQLKPSTLFELTEARAIYCISSEFEVYLNKALQNVSNMTQKRILVEEIDLLILPNRKPNDHTISLQTNHELKETTQEQRHEEEHAHENEKENEHNNDHEKAHDTISDYHLWLHPQNAKKLVKFFAEDLGKLYPEHAKFYKENADNYLKKIDALDSEIAKILEDVKDKEYAVTHDAYQYFEYAYGLKQGISILDGHHSYPSPKKIYKLKDLFEKENIRCIFVEPQFNNRLIKVFTKDKGVQVSVLDALGANLEEGEQMYLNMLKQIAANIKSCMSE